MKDRCGFLFVRYKSAVQTDPPRLQPGTGIEHNNIYTRGCEKFFHVTTDLYWKWPPCKIISPVSEGKCKGKGA